MKDYFGEKIGLYVVWQRHFTLWLMPAALVGVLMWLDVAYNGITIVRFTHLNV